MRYSTLGRSGLAVTDLALGTMVFGEDSPRSASAEDSVRMIHAYLDAGGNHIDTANVYAGGRSEEIVGSALTGRRADVVLATKVRFPVGEGPNAQGLSRRHIMASVSDSLGRLGTDWIDLLYMHAWDPLTPIEESLEAFDDLVVAGDVRYIGVSNFKAWQAMKALGLSESNGWARFIAGQYQYSLVERDVEDEIADLALSEEIGLVPWSPLGGGFLTGKYGPGDKPGEGRLATQPDRDEEAWHRRDVERNWRILDVVDEIATDLGVGHAAVALAWLRAKPFVGSVIVGVRTMEQLASHLDASRLVLGPESMARLDEVSQPAPRYPQRFLSKNANRTLD